MLITTVGTVLGALLQTGMEDKIWTFVEAVSKGMFVWVISFIIVCAIGLI